MKCILIVFLLLTCGVSVSAQQKDGGVAPGTKYFKMLESTKQNVVQSEQTRTNYHFVAVWEGNQPPETVFWRGQNGWLTCDVRATHTKGIGKRAVYVVDSPLIDLSRVRKGDVIAIDPVVGGRFPVPAEIPETAVNTLFFKTAGSGWMYCPVKKIKKKSSMKM